MLDLKEIAAGIIFILALIGIFGAMVVDHFSVQQQIRDARRRELDDQE